MITQDKNIPSHLTPVSLITGAVEVMADPREKTDSNGDIKRSKDFNAAGWIVPVEVVRGTRTKALPDGREVSVLDTEPINITVWSDSRPLVSAGMYVRLIEPMIGAFNGSIYVQCLGVEDIETADFSLEKALSDDEA
jgi:hypothetical protein